MNFFSLNHLFSTRLTNLIAKQIMPEIVQRSSALGTLHSGRRSLLHGEQLDQ
jgi:hypothetical protein